MEEQTNKAVITQDHLYHEGSIFDSAKGKQIALSNNGTIRKRGGDANDLYDRRTPA